MSGSLADSIVAFGRVLRRAGLPVGPGRIADAMRAVEAVGIERRDDFYWALSAIFISHHEHEALFGEAFSLFWRDPVGVGRPASMLLQPRQKVPVGRPRPGAARAADALFEAGQAWPAPEVVEVRLAASEEEIFRHRDFAEMTVEEIAEASRRVAELRLPDERRKTRRFAASHEGRVDARRTIRASLRTGGRMILPKLRRPIMRPPPVVALCDISGSMSRYSRILLHFLHALGRRRSVASFLFGTSLTNVTRELRLRDADAALAACSAAVPDWGGGTRIAAAVDAFNRLWSRRVLGQGAVVLLVSDGLERQDSDDLGPAMDRLHRSCRRLIWLNPLLRFDGFKPRAHGIRTMLPHVDALLPVHSLASVDDLCRALSDGGRGAKPSIERWRISDSPH